MIPREAREADAQDRVHVLYLGSSADLDALRRSLEAHGAVTRARLTPQVAVVVADATVAAGHPTRRAAATLGVPVLDPVQAFDQLADWSCRPDPTPGRLALSGTGGTMIAGTIATLVTVLALLSVIGSVTRPDEVSRQVRLPAGTSLPVPVSPN